MAEVRMSLTDAGAALGVAPNTIRSRWKAGKINGERDNAGKVWVWVDMDAAANDETSNPSKGDVSNLSKDDGSKGSKRRFSKLSKGLEVSALEDHLKTLKEQLATAMTELSDLRPKAAEAERLRAENVGLRGQLDIRAEQLEELRRLLAEAKEGHAEELRRWAEQQRVKGFFARLFGR